MEQAKLDERPSLALRRRFAAAPDKVWRAWTDPQALRHWWGPGEGEPVSAAELDVRVGGRFRIVFGGASGTQNECAGEYREVVPNRKLVFTWCWPNTTPERVSLVTLLFEPDAGGTVFELRHEQFHDEAARDGHNRGWDALLAKLGRFVAE